jgi:diadenosine tetraphosphate (Ap4A) HIT family hydrolase
MTIPEILRQVGLLLAATAIGFDTTIAQTSQPSTGAIATPIPSLYDVWKRAIGQPNLTDAQLRALAEQNRARVQALKDPFSPLASLTCDRRPSNEHVVWEDTSVMALVDRYDIRTKLLVVPKRKANFVIDLADIELSRLEKASAAGCDAPVIDASGTVAIGSCSFRVGPPTGLDVAQLHVHVLRSTNQAPNLSLFQRAGRRMVSLLGGTSCP